MDVITTWISWMCLGTLLLSQWFGRCNTTSFCDECDCYRGAIYCDGVDFNEVVQYPIPGGVAESATYLQVTLFAGTLELRNDTLTIFHSLESLYISTYVIGYISDAAFESLPNLSYISLYLNALREFPYRALSRLNASLTELHLTYQEFAFIPANVLKDFKRMTTLRIFRNIHDVVISPSAFNGMVNLVSLYLPANGIRTLDQGIFGNLSRIRELDLSHNFFEYVPPAVDTLHSLEVLDLSYNARLNNTRKLQFLDEMPHLQTLQLGYCAIPTIPIEAVKRLSIARNLTVANFDGNPFNCTLELCPFADWQLKRPVPSTTRSPIPFITVSPPPGKGPYQCQDGRSLQDFYADMCVPVPTSPLPFSTPSSIKGSPWYLKVVLAILGCFFIAIAAFVVWKFRLVNPRHHNRRFAVHHVHQRIRSNGSDDADGNREYLFDVYVSHHEDDRPFVEEEMLPRLEGDSNFELCVSFRNFRLGSNRLDNVTSALDVSRVALFLINERFLQNGQCKLELEMASSRLMEDEAVHHGQRVIVVLLEALADHLVPPTLRLLRTHTTCLEWDPAAEERYWGQLVATLSTVLPARDEVDAEVADGAGDEDDEAFEEGQEEDVDDEASI